MVKLNIKIHLFKAACILILMYGCETWLITETLTDKLDILAITCYCIILGIEKSRYHVTNESLYYLTGQAPLRERQLKLTAHHIRTPTDERANRFVIYESKIKSSLRTGAPKTTYLNQICLISYLNFFILLIFFHLLQARRRSKQMK